MSRHTAKPRPPVGTVLDTLLRLHATATRHEQEVRLRQKTIGYVFKRPNTQRKKYQWQAFDADHVHVGRCNTVEHAVFVVFQTYLSATVEGQKLLYPDAPTPY